MKRTETKTSRERYGPIRDLCKMMGHLKNQLISDQDSLRPASVLSIAFLLLVCSPILATSQNFTEQDLKVAYIYKFADYIDQASENLVVPNAPITIGVLASKPVAQKLEKATSGKKVRNRGFAIRLFRTAEEVQSCNFLFIPSSQKLRISNIPKNVLEGQTVFIADNRDFIDPHCHIAFLIKRGKVKFVINRARAEEDGIRISSRLLKVAEEVIE